MLEHPAPRTLRDAELAVEAAITRGENDSRLLDGRDYASAMWDEARAALDVLVKAATT